MAQEGLVDSTYMDTAIGSDASMVDASVGATSIDAASVDATMAAPVDSTNGDADSYGTHIHACCCCFHGVTLLFQFKHKS